MRTEDSWGKQYFAKADLWIKLFQVARHAMIRDTAGRIRFIACTRIRYYEWLEQGSEQDELVDD